MTDLSRERELALVRALVQRMVLTADEAAAFPVGLLETRGGPAFWVATESIWKDSYYLTPAGRLLAQAIRQRDLATARGMKRLAWRAEHFPFGLTWVHGARTARLLRHWGRRIREGKL